MTERTHVSRRHIQLTTCKERKNGQHLPNFYLFVEIMVLGGASWQFRTWALRGFSLLLAWHNCLLNEKTKAHAAYMVFIRRALITSGQPVIGGWSYQKSSFYSSTSTHNKTHYQLLCPQWLGLFFAHHGEPFYPNIGRNLPMGRNLVHAPDQWGDSALLAPPKSPMFMSYQFKFFCQNLFPKNESFKLFLQGSGKFWIKLQMQQNYKLLFNKTVALLGSGGWNLDIGRHSNAEGFYEPAMYIIACQLYFSSLEQLYFSSLPIIFATRDMVVLSWRKTGWYERLLRTIACQYTWLATQEWRHSLRDCLQCPLPLLGGFNSLTFMYMFIPLYHGNRFLKLAFPATFMFKQLFSPILPSNGMLNGSFERKTPSL